MIKKATNDVLNEINSLINDYIVDINSNPYINCYYMEVNNEIIGFIDYSHIYDKAELNYIFINEKYRRLGYAQKLFNHMLNDLSNVINITLEVNVNNLAAIKFYEKNDFKIVSRRERYYNGVDAYLMLKKVK